jgi:hypothetical protein
LGHADVCVNDHATDVSSRSSTTARTLALKRRPPCERPEGPA